MRFSPSLPPPAWRRLSRPPADPREPSGSKNDGPGDEVGAARTGREGSRDVRSGLVAHLFKRVYADGACISAGGMCAFYPTDVPFHHRSEWLGDKDTFGYLVRGCRKLNMTVIARVHPHCIRDDAAKAHPDWVAVNANGQKARHMVIPTAGSVALGPCNFEFMPQVLTEIVTALWR